jgi:hypothetical protein
VIQSKKVVIKKGGWSFLECLGEDWAQARWNVLSPCPKK